MSKSLLISYLAAVVTVGLSAPGEANDLSVAADTPTVTVSTRPARRNFMELPALQYHFRIEAACSAGQSADTFSLSIADTRVSLPKDRLAERSNEITVTIPAGQIPPVRIEGFCIAESDELPEEESVRISSVLSAQSSLICVGDAGDDITYTSTPLDVLVNCLPAEDLEAEE